MFQRTLDLYHKQLVIGSDLSALSYAYMNKSTLVYKNLLKPYKYNKEENWIEEKALWNKLAFLLTQGNYLPFNTNIESFRLEENNLLKVFTKSNLIVNIHFDNLVISDDNGIIGLPPVEARTNNDFWVVDYFNVPCGCNHDIDFLFGNDNFIKKIYFYKSKRTFANDVKDIVAVSLMNGEEISSPDYSQAIARLKIIKMMKKAGIKGRPNGFYKEKQCYRPIYIESNKRTVYPLGKNIYKDLPININILYDDYRNILNGKEVINQKIEKIKRLYGIN